MTTLRIGKLALYGKFLSSLLAKLVLFLTTLCILTYACFTLCQILFAPPVELYPMIQFDRGGFTKADILDISQHALRTLSKLPSNEDTADDDDGHEDIPPIKLLLNVEDRRTRRQLMALEALGLSSEEDFELLAGLGYSSPTDTNNAWPSEDDYKSFSERVEYRAPDYDRLCPDFTFTLASPRRQVDTSFCSRLQSLGRAIEEGREKPLLTLFVWWLDPISDEEILSRKSMLANWNLLRPFVVPVVFTNYRMNMAFANGFGWPCFPATETNSDGLPVFPSMDRVVTNKFDSTFYGYARPIAMFDSSVLETLMAIKDRYIIANPKDSDSVEHDFSKTLKYPNLDRPIVIHGSSFMMPHTGPDPFVNFEHLYKYLRENPLNAGTVSLEQSNYILYRGIDFTDMPQLVAHDDFLFQFVLDLSARQGSAVIDASKTLLAVQTFRLHNTNEWGRHYLKSIAPNQSYNRRLATSWYNKDRQKQKIPQDSELFLSTRYDARNNSCVFISRH